MKRILFAVVLFIILLICAGFPLIAHAESMGIMNTDVSGYLTPEEFGTFAGQVTFLVMVVQFIKLPIDRKVVKTRTEYLVYVVAVFTQVLAQATFHGFESFTWAYVPKCIAYSFLLAVTGKEVYIKAIGNVESKKAELKRQAAEASPEIMKPAKGPSEVPQEIKKPATGAVEVPPVTMKPPAGAIEVPPEIMKPAAEHARRKEQGTP